MVYVKSDKTPHTDERTTNNVLKLWAYTSQIFLILFFVSLGVLGLIGVETIQITHLLITLITYFFMAGIGSLISKYR